MARYEPEVTAGNSAGELFNGAIGNGDDAASAAAYKKFQDSTGYQTTLDNSLAATNASAYATGLGRSGVALKALQDRGAYNAQQTFQSWLSNLNTSQQTGLTAKGGISGIALNTLNSNNQSSSNAANAASNSALATANGWASAVQNIGNLATDAFKSSYGDKKS